MSYMWESFIYIWTFPVFWEIHQFVEIIMSYSKIWVHSIIPQNIVCILLGYTTDSWYIKYYMILHTVWQYQRFYVAQCLDSQKTLYASSSPVSYGVTLVSNFGNITMTCQECGNMQWQHVPRWLISCDWYFFYIQTVQWNFSDVKMLHL